MKDRIQPRRERPPLAAADLFADSGLVAWRREVAQQVIRSAGLIDPEDETSEDADDDTPSHHVVAVVFVHNQG
jgi:hypothetical protein